MDPILRLPTPADAESTFATCAGGEATLRAKRLRVVGPKRIVAEGIAARSINVRREEKAAISVGCGTCAVELLAGDCN